MSGLEINKLVNNKQFWISQLNLISAKVLNLKKLHIK